MEGRKGRAAPFVTVLMVAVGALGAWLYAMVDTMAVPLWVVAAFGAVWSLFLIPFSFWMARRPWRALYGAFWLVLLATWSLPWYVPKNFCRDVGRIRPGMTVTDVRERLGPWVQGVPPYMGGDGYGWAGTQHGRYVNDPWTITDGEIGIPGGVAYRHHPDLASSLSADWAVIIVKDGRVVGTEFSPD